MFPTITRELEIIYRRTHTFVTVANPIPAGAGATPSISSGTEMIPAPGTGTLVANGNTLSFVNYFGVEFPPGTYQLEEVDGIWRLDPISEDGSGIDMFYAAAFVLIDSVVAKATLDGAGNVVPTATGSVLRRIFDGTAIVATTEQIVAYNVDMERPVPPGLYRIYQHQGTKDWIIALGSSPLRGCIDVILKDTDIAVVDPAGAVCTLQSWAGPDTPGQVGDDITVHNPLDIPGWKIVAKWNYVEERYEVVSTNYGTGTNDVFRVSLVEVVDTGGGTPVGGDADNEARFRYRVVDPEVPSRVLAADVQPNENLHDYVRPVGRTIIATRGTAVWLPDGNDPNLKLSWINEVPDTRKCEPTTPA